jgi:hypothetical protein
VPQTIRNIAIILALAAAVDFLPGGGNAAAAVLTALSMIFLAAIAWLLYRVYNEQQLTIASLSDGRKAGLFGAVGAIALLIVAYDKFRSWEGGIVLWVALMAACLGAIFMICARRRPTPDSSLIRGARRGSRDEPRPSFGSWGRCSRPVATCGGRHPSSSSPCSRRSPSAS